MTKVKESGTADRKARRPSGGRGRKRVPGRTRLSAKNQITLPVDVVRKANLLPGDELVVEVDDKGRLFVARAEIADKPGALEQFAGCLPTGSSAEYYASRELARQREVDLGLIAADDVE